MGHQTFFVVCVAGDTWHDVETLKPTTGPAKSEVCEVDGTFVFNNEGYYHIKGWNDPADPEDGFLAKHFVPLQQQTVYVSVPETIKEQTGELILS